MEKEERKKQITTMAEILKQASEISQFGGDLYNPPEVYIPTDMDIATALYDNGVRKIPDGSEIITTEEKQLLFARGYSAGASEKEVEMTLKVFNDIEETVNMRLDDEREEARKELATELLQMLYDDAIRYGKSVDGILHMAEKFGVKVKRV